MFRNVIFISDEHSENEFQPISVILSGIVIFVSDENSLKTF